MDTLILILALLGVGSVGFGIIWTIASIFELKAEQSWYNNQISDIYKDIKQLREAILDK